MRVTYICLAFLAVTAYADVASTLRDNFARIPEEFNNLMPDEISDYIKSLSPDESTAYQTAAKKYKEFKNADDYSDFIKKQSPDLYKKSVKLQETMKQKFASLSEEARAFVEMAHAQALRIHARYIGGEIPSVSELAEMGKTQMERYKKLSQEAKDSIASNFPSFHEMANTAKDIYGSIKDTLSNSDVASTLQDTISKIPAQFNSFMPDDILEYIKSLSPEETEVYQTAAKKYKDFKNSDDYTAFLKKQSPELYKKSVKLQDAMKKKLGSLSGDAKSYVESAYAEAQKIQSQYVSGEVPSMDELKKMATDQMDKYKKLSQKAKDSIKSSFPSFHEMAMKAQDGVFEFMNDGISTSSDVGSTIKDKLAKIPKEFNSLVPDEISEYIESLSDEESDVMQKAAKKYKEFKNSDDYSEFIKKQSPELHKKWSKLQDSMDEKLGSLSGDAKDFIEEAYAEGQKVYSQYMSGETPSMSELKDMGKKQLEKFEKLSQEAKDSIEKEFPTFHKMAVSGLGGASFLDTAKNVYAKAKDYVYGTAKDENNNVASTIKDKLAKIPAEFTSILPDEMSEYIESLSEKESNIMEEAAKKYKDFKNADDYSDFLKKQSPELHKKSMKLQDAMKKKLGDMSDEAKKFIEEAYADGQKLSSQYISGDTPSLDELKKMGKKQMAKYQKLSDKAKDSIKDQFPSFHEMAQKAKEIYGTIKDEF